MDTRALGSAANDDARHQKPAQRGALSPSWAARARLPRLCPTFWAVRGKTLKGPDRHLTFPSA